LEMEGKGNTQRDAVGLSPVRWARESKDWGEGYSFHLPLLGDEVLMDGMTISTCIKKNPDGSGKTNGWIISESHQFWSMQSLLQQKLRSSA